MSWTSAEVRKFIRHMLGEPRRKVELDQAQISAALKRAVAYYSAKKPIIRKDFINVQQGVQAYDLEALGKNVGKGILNVYQEPITSPSAVFTEFEYYRLRQPPYVDMSELISDRLYYKEVGILTGTDFDWEFDWHTKKILVKPIPTRSFTLAYDYDHSPVTIEEVRLNDQGWVVDYTLALCKEMLARIRGKFQGVPGNDLPVDTDASDLLSEGLEAQSNLKEKLMESRGDWTPPILG